MPVAKVSWSGADGLVDAFAEVNRPGSGKGHSFFGHTRHTR